VGAIKSAFIKADTKVNLITIETPREMIESAISNRLVKIKLEMDSDPLSGIISETVTLFEPFPFSIRIVTSSCLFAEYSEPNLPPIPKINCRLFRE